MTAVTRRLAMAILNGFDAFFAEYKNITLGAGIDNLLNFTDTQNVTNIPGRLYFAKLNLTL